MNRFDGKQAALYYQLKVYLDAVWKKAELKNEKRG